MNATLPRLCGSRFAGAVAFFVLALMIRLANHEHEPITDELYHLLAGASWVEDGTLSIAGGEYDRASLYTKLVGATVQLGGGDYDAARLLGIFLGALLVAWVYWWTRVAAGRMEAAIAAGALAILPGAVFLSHYIRFYTLHALVFWVAATIVYSLATDRSGSVLGRAVRVALVVILLGFGTHLQITTLIGIAALIGWLILANGWGLVQWIGGRSRSQRLAVGSAVVVAAALGILALLGPLRPWVDAYQGSVLWNINSNATYYLRFYQVQLHALWSLLPVAMIIAIWSRPSPALFAVVVFSVSLLFQSFGGIRAERFLFYAMPFFAVIWGIAAATLIRLSFRALDGIYEKNRLFVARGRLRNACSVVLVGGLTAYALLMTPAVEMTLRMLADRQVRGPRGDAQYWSVYDSSWSEAREKVREIVGSTDLFVTSQGLHALYFIGDFDVEVNATRLYDFADGTGPGVDPRTGKRVIADAGALRELVACHETGAVVVHRGGWRNPRIVAPEVADFMDDAMARVDVPPSWGLEVYRWDGRHRAAAGGCTAG